MQHPRTSTLLVLAVAGSLVISCGYLVGQIPKTSGPTVGHKGIPLSPFGAS